MRPINADEVEAAADVLDASLAAYLTAHPTARAARVTVLDVIKWIRDTVTATKRSTN